jgi:hypothetical protein
MTDNDRLRVAARRVAERTRKEQGLPPTVEDPAVLHQIATLILGADHG